MSHSLPPLLSARRAERDARTAQHLPLSAWCLIGFTTLLVSGCASTHGQLVSFLRSTDATVATGHYTVMPPDVVALHAPGAPELDGVRQRVRPDGKLALRLLGEVEVAGLTTQEIAEKLKAQLSRYYIEPEVVVEISDYRSQNYYVFGEVGNPGARPFTGRDTLLDALARARPTFLAWRSQIRVVRPGPNDDSRKTIVIDLDKMVRSGETDQNILLQPGDIIEVPPTPLAWVGHRMRELLYPIQPAVQAYTRPADVIDANDTYSNHDDSDDRRHR